MATKKSAEEPEAEQQDAEPERVIDPPEASADDLRDSESPGGTERVHIDQMATLTLPSGASYALNAGEVLDLSSEDAAFIIDQGYGSKADEPSGE